MKRCIWRRDISRFDDVEVFKSVILEPLLQRWYI